MENKDQWLNWAIELQGLAQAGLTYGKDVLTSSATHVFVKLPPRSCL